MFRSGERLPWGQPVLQQYLFICTMDKVMSLIKFGWDHPLNVGSFFPVTGCDFWKCLIAASFTTVPLHKVAVHPASSLTQAASAVSPLLAFGCRGGRGLYTRHGALCSPFLLHVPFLSLVCTILPDLIHSCRRKSFIPLLYCPQWFISD